MNEILITRFQDHMDDLNVPDYLIDYWMYRIYGNILTESELTALLHADLDDLQRDYDYSINY